jgi:RNA polymerase sigma-70 factor (ECF subfamily)
VETVEQAFRANERLLWGLGYRMTGVAADADELVQETFLRAIEHPVPDDGRPLRPWLVRVCANLARDRLRARRRRQGPQVWLPAPVPDERLLDDPDGTDRRGRDHGRVAPRADSRRTATSHPPHPAASDRGADPADRAGDRPDTRYSRAESARFAFLLALEELTPTQRAVLLLRDVFDHDAAEVAELLGTSPGAVRVAHHKARRALAAYDATRRPPDPSAHLVALTTFLGALAAGDAATALAVLAPQVELRNDGGGVYHAARMPVRGAEKVFRFLVSVSADPGEVRWAVHSLNGLPMVVLDLLTPGPGRAPRSVIGVTLGSDGLIVGIQWVLDPRKLGAVPAPDVGTPGAGNSVPSLD